MIRCCREPLLNYHMKHVSIEEKVLSSAANGIITYMLSNIPCQYGEYKNKKKQAWIVNVKINVNIDKRVHDPIWLVVRDFAEVCENILMVLIMLTTTLAMLTIKLWKENSALINVGTDSF